MLKRGQMDWLIGAIVVIVIGILAVIIVTGLFNRGG